MLTYQLSCDLQGWYARFPSKEQQYYTFIQEGTSFFITKGKTTSLPVLLSRAQIFVAIILCCLVHMLCVVSSLRVCIAKVVTWHLYPRCTYS